MFATSIIASLGAITLAASEIMRQVFIISMQSFTALDISSQALVASYLGKVGPGLVPNATVDACNEVSHSCRARSARKVH